jgi:hypothetical protein
MAIPAGFGDEFLDWFRAATEQAWARFRERSFLSWVGGGVGGADWQHATRWSAGLAEAEIEAIERQWSLRFPPDYRRFLRRLHATDRPMIGAGFADSGAMVPLVTPGFYSWLGDTAAIRAALDGVFEGLLFDVEENGLWPASWGPRPERADDRRHRVRALLERAPRLVPLLGHRFLVAEPDREGNPVLSIVQSDIIVYGSDLRDYLLIEFGELLGLEGQVPIGGREERAIPFWGDLLG